MIKKILTLAGFVEDKTFKETRFLKPPKTTYAVYMDSYNRRGADNKNLYKAHSSTIELYSYKADPTSEKRIEDEFDALGIEYTKGERIWLESEQLFQVTFDFDFIEK